MLNEFLKFPRPSHSVYWNTMTLLKIPTNMRPNDSIMNNRPFLKRNVSEETVGQFKRWKSTQSSCEEDGCSQKPRQRIEDQQGCDSCEKSHLEYDSDRHSFTENCQKSNSDLCHRECHQSIESNAPTFLEKPVAYNNNLGCNSHSPTATDNNECRKSTSCCTAENSTTEKEICDGQTSTEYSKSLADECNERRSEKARECDLEQVTYLTQRCCETKTQSIDKDAEKCSVKKSKDIQIKPDPPPPKYPHWTENPPPYCNYCQEKRPIVVKPSLMMFSPRKGSWKSNIKLFSWLRKTNCKTSKKDKRSVVKAERVGSCLQKTTSHRVISFKDDKYDFLMFPMLTSKFKDKIESKIQEFPPQSTYHYCVQKSEKENLDISKSNARILNNQSNESYKMRTIRTNTPDSLEAQKSSLSYYHNLELAQKGIEVLTKMERGLSDEWRRQRYKIRLKIFQKKNGQLDPSPPQIGELRQPHSEAVRPFLFDNRKFEFNIDQERLPPQSEHPCFYPSNWPVIVSKSYPTKMKECKMLARKRRSVPARTELNFGRRTFKPC